MSESRDPLPNGSRSGGLSPNFSLGDRVREGMANIGEFEMPIAVEKANAMVDASSIDTKTSLLTQQAWFGNFSHAMETMQPDDSMTVYVSDLNGFKAVNDELGHDVGDELLGIVGKAYKEVFFRRRDTDVAAHGSREKKNDSVARLGGDEFAVYVLKNAHNDNEQRTTTNIEEMQQQPDRINQELKKLLAGTKFEKFNISLSVGAAEYQEGDTPESLFAKADLEMFKVKYNGKIENLSPEDLEQLSIIVPFLQKIGHRVEAWALLAVKPAA